MGGAIVAFVIASVGCCPNPSLVAVPAFSGIAALVPGVLLGSVTSLAVTVCEGVVFRVTLKVFVPATSAALAGSVAFVSLDVMCTRCVLLIRFQFASTEFTVTMNGFPAVCVLGVP